MADRARVFFSRVPIVGVLAHTSMPAIIEAIVEMSLSVVFSTLPIWFAGALFALPQFFDSVPFDKRGFDTFLPIYLDAVVKTIANGELLMYVTASLGPTLYIGLSSFGKKGKPFPWVRPQLIVAVLINLFATALFFVARDKGFASETALIMFSALLYLTSLLLLFPAMAYEHDRARFEPSEVQREEQDEFANGYRRHRD